MLRSRGIRIFESAYRHGQTDDEIRHAWANAIAFFDIDREHEPTKSLCIGPDTAGNLLEVLYLQLPDGELVIHAMPLRAEFRVLLSGG